MRTAKLNKNQTWELIQSAVEAAMAESTAFKKGTEAEFKTLLLAKLNTFSPKTGGGVSTKVNNDGLVYCNYFDDYYAPSEFKTKLNKAKTAEVYKANCIEAETILRKIKILRYNVEKQVMANFMDRTITAEEMETILQHLELKTGNVFASANDVPTVNDIISLR
jgi:hypothetical protein